MSLKLCYIWVREYRNFRNTGFNFSSEIKFNYDSSTRVLASSRIESLPRNFFGNSITEVIGLIGKNGSGKSNALELVCKLLKGGNSALGSGFLIITKEKGEYICHESNVNFIDNQTNIRIQSYVGSIDAFKIVYFSNVFDERIHNFDKEVSDISSNYRYPRNRYPYTISKTKSDFEKQLEFIGSKLFKDLNINHPQKIRVTSRYWNSTRQLPISIANRENSNNNEIEYFLKEFRKRINDIKDHNNSFYYLVTYSLFIETLRVLNKNDARIDSSFFKLEDLLNSIGFSYNNLDRTDKIVLELQNWIFATLGGLRNDVTGKYKAEIENIYKQVKILGQLKTYFKELDIKYVKEGSRSRKNTYFIFDYKKIRKENGKLFYELFRNQRIFQIDWIGISSGHKAYINIFSLLHHELKRVRKINLLLCIDEGDLYLHPQWQIEFFDRLIKVLPELFKGDIQIILTSHSPFLLSDLPKQNVTIIDGQLDEKSAFDGITLNKQTFAGNIYNLYSEPFFLGNDRTSIFAKRKIQEMLFKIDNSKNESNEIEVISLKKEIELIGDDIIRLHMLKRLNND